MKLPARRSRENGEAASRASTSCKRLVALRGQGIAFPAGGGLRLRRRSTGTGEVIDFSKKRNEA